MSLEAVISAGGKGTRLGTLAGELPKVLIPVGGRPLLHYHLTQLIEYGVERIWLLTGYLSDRIEEYLQEIRYPVPIEVLRESTPLGTGGGLARLKGILSSDFLFLYGDLAWSIDIGRLLEFHKKSGSLLTLLTHPNSHPYDSDIIIADSSNVVLGMLAKNAERSEAFNNLSNAGIFILAPEVLDGLYPDGKADFEKDLLLPSIKTGRVFSYRTTEYVKDMGTPDRLAVVQADQASGRIQRRRLTCPQKAVFIDRDGTMNKHVGLLTRPDQLELIQGAAEAIRSLNQTDYLCFMVSNQPVVARNLCSYEGIESIHRELETKLAAGGGYLDDSRFCPHHPDRGYPGENPAYKVACGCRKPKTGMLTDLGGKYNVDISESWIIGDTTGDIQTAKNAGARSILVLTGEAGRDGKYAVSPDFVCADLLKAVELIRNIEGRC